MEQYGLEDSAYLPRRSKEEDVTDVAELGAASRSRKTNLTKEDVATEPLMVTMAKFKSVNFPGDTRPCLLYTSPSPRDRQKSRMPSSA